MAMDTYAGHSTQQKTWYDKVLLKRLLAKRVFLQHGQKKAMPKNEGDTVNFRRFNRLEPATTALTEGVTPTGNNLSISEITATVAQYGDFVTITDKLDLVGIDPVATETVEVQGEQASETLDIVVRNVVAAGTNVYYPGGGTSRVEVEAGHTIDGDAVRRIRQIMARNNVKSPRGSDGYIAFIHPDNSHDVMGDAQWKDVALYQGGTKIVNGEIGKLHGVRFVETTLAPVWEDEGAASADVYGIIVIGADAYGVPDIAGSSKPETIIKGFGSGGTSDPLNQRSTIGWKAMLATVRLQELAILRVEVAASVGALS